MTSLDNSPIPYFEFTQERVRHLDRFQIFGERRCGTNYVRSLVEQNFDLSPTRDYGWKHGIPQFPVLPRRCLFVVVVRDPFKWATSFFNGAYEAHPSVSKRTFDDFLRGEWVGQYRPAKSPWGKYGYTIDPSVARGEELQLDRHPITGKRFETIFEMRTVKNLAYLGLLERGINVVVLRFEDTLALPKEICELISENFNLKSKSFKPIQNIVGPKGLKKVDKRIASLSEDQRDFVISQLDPNLEKRFGYI